VGLPLCKLKAVVKLFYARQFGARRGSVGLSGAQWGSVVLGGGGSAQK
jgi:hypothetical protein